MFQRLPVAQVRAGNTSQILLNEICQVLYSLFWENEITEKEFDKIMNSVDEVIVQ